MSQGWEMMSWYGMIFGPIMMVLMLGVAVVVVVLIVRWLGGGFLLGSGPSPPPERIHKTPLEILEERFAKGEIETDEFQEKKRHLLE
ncbi:MAG: SHOCT domain-containing protein [Paracoccaceae bacterium]